MEFDDLQPLRRAGAGDAEEVPDVTPEFPPGAGLSTNPIAQLVADLIETTGLIPLDRLASARSRVGGGSLAEAIMDERLNAPAGGLEVPGLRTGPRPAPDARARELAERLHLPYVDLASSGVEKGAAEAIPIHVLERVGAIPYRIVGDQLRIAVADPTNVQAIDELRIATRYTLEIGVAPREEIDLELRRLQKASEAWERAALVEEEFDLGDEEEEEGDDLEADDGVSDAPLVRLVNSIILQAAEDGASDIHFDPQDDALVVRSRVDGVLHELQRIPKRLAPGVTTRLKVLAKLDIAERRKPQDGRISLNAKAAGRLLDIRVAVLPTVEGEGVVMRLLDKSKRPPTLSELGLSDEMRAVFEEIVVKPTGALLVTGPTGSGKSTTLYASLNEINRPEINIITVEDPVEYRLAGLNQVQVNLRAGMTFSAALRSILRSDPDVVMVGEIRDAETAKMAIEAALTGHFVLSTLHTNDAPSALTRLNEMGVEPFLTGSAVTAVLAQRLARKLCTHCCEMYMATREEMLEARFSAEQAASADGVALYRKRGCPRCNQTGYKGRIGIYQLMVMNEDVSRLAAQHASREELERAALSAGMKTLWDDGLSKVVSGLTSLEELARVLV
ncbi:MAG TPA: GspE/PulE family protein [Gaiellaceae bacterium]|nr:GspE/PulE family protein [Gaiellaceae bacterium]